MTLEEAYRKSRQSLSPLYGDDEGRAMARRLLEDAFSISPSRLLINGADPFGETDRLEACLDRLLAHEPLQYITGFEWFRGLRIGVGPGVLIPRPETAELLDWVTLMRDDHKKQVLADICTGSGCIALALKKEFPGADIIATDISKTALKMAKENEEKNFSDKSIRFIEHDILLDKWISGMPDIVVCNPPYIAFSEASSMQANVLDYEPHLALFVNDEDTLVFYKKVIAAFLPGTACIFFELNPETAGMLSEYCRNLGLRMEQKADMQGKTRFAKIYA